MTTESFAFSAETGKVLRLMIHSLYTNKDIFLRELISNASDACDKLRYAALQDGALDASDLHVLITSDEEAGVITVEDNGAGMNREDLISNLGVIARSGTQAFMEAMERKESSPELIGKFGVGFYSAFMAAQTVTVFSRKAGEKEGWRWVSDGENGYTVEQDDEGTPARGGTRIVLSLRDEEKEYASEHRIRHIVRIYSDHVPYPVKLLLKKAPLSGTASETPEVINSASALWLRSKSEITAEQYGDFYRHVSHAADDPWLTLHGEAEGAAAYRYLLFVPTLKPFDLYNPDRITRVRLYVRRVFITDEHADIIPRYLRFMRGVIDSPDLPLNISRETLQHSAPLRRIRKAVTSKIFSELKAKLHNDREGYVAFWEKFGPVIKEGLCESIEADKEKLLELCLFRTTGDAGWTTLAEAAERAGEDRKYLYYVVGDDPAKVKGSPQLEAFAKKNVEVLVFTDPVDDFWVHTLTEFREKELVNAASAGADPENETAEQEGRDDAAYEDLCDWYKEALKGRALDVRVSHKLTESPVCLAIQDGGMDMRLERFLISQNQLPKASPKILEVNPDHALVKLIFERRDQEGALILFEQACVAEGEALADPYAYGRRIVALLQKLAG